MYRAQFLVQPWRRYVSGGARSLFCVRPRGAATLSIDQPWAWSIALCLCSLRAHRNLCGVVPSLRECVQCDTSAAARVHDWLRRSVARACAQVPLCAIMRTHMMCVDRYRTLYALRRTKHVGFPVHRGSFREAMRPKPYTCQRFETITLSASEVGDAEILAFQKDYVQRTVEEASMHHACANRVFLCQTVASHLMARVDHLQFMKHALCLPCWSGRDTLRLLSYIDSEIEWYSSAYMHASVKRSRNNTWSWEEATHAVAEHLSTCVRAHCDHFPSTCVPVVFQRAAHGEPARYKLSPDGKTGYFIFCPSRISADTLCATCSHEIYPGHNLQLTHQFGNRGLSWVKRYRMMTPATVCREAVKAAASCSRRHLVPQQSRHVHNSARAHTTRPS